MPYLDSKTLVYTITSYYSSQNQFIKLVHIQYQTPHFQIVASFNP